MQKTQVPSSGTEQRWKNFQAPMGVVHKTLAYWDTSLALLGLSFFIHRVKTEFFKWGNFVT